MNHSERNADPRADNQRDNDPLVLNQIGVEERSAHGQCGADLAGQDSSPRRRRRTEPLQRKNEQDRRDEVCKIDELLDRESAHDFLDLPDLNMRSIRSVMKNPPTMLLKDAA